MAFSCGFYDAIDNDRTYSATQFGEMFDGLITDGIYATIGDAFAVVPGSGVGVKVKPGRAWFNKTWSVNTADLPLTLADPDLLLSRIDAVILEVDTRVITRNNSIKVITGNPGIDPEKPTLIRADGIYQYPLAWVTVDKNISVIAASKIENNIGLAPTPFVTGILKSITIDELWTQWEGQFDDWFQNVQSQLEGNVALNLQHQIDQLKTNKVSVSDKATTEDIKNGISDKWVDAKEVGNFVNNTLMPSFGETTLTPTKYPMIGQSLSTSEHSELFNKVGYKYGFGDLKVLNGIRAIYNASDASPQHSMCVGDKMALIGRTMPLYYRSDTSASAPITTTYSSISKSSYAIALLGETDTHALSLEYGNDTTAFFRIYNFPIDAAKPYSGSVQINTATTVMNKLNINLSPCILGTTIKWPYLYTLNNLIYMGVVTATSYTTTPNLTTAIVQIPTSSDTVNWTDASLQNGIDRSIVLDGKVYIHVINKSGVVVIYVYDLFTSSWVTISTAEKKLVENWTEKYGNFDYSTAAYDSFKCMKIGSVKAKPDGSLIEYGLIYVDPTTKEIKVHEDTTSVLTKGVHTVIDCSNFDLLYPDRNLWRRIQYYKLSDTVSEVVRTYRLDPSTYQVLADSSYDIYFQFYKGKAVITVLWSGLVPEDPLVGIEYFDPLDKLVPIQPYIDFGYKINANDVVAGDAEGFIYFSRTGLIRITPQVYGIKKRNYVYNSNDPHTTCRFGNNNLLTISFTIDTVSMPLPGYPYDKKKSLAFAYLGKSTISDMPAGKFRLLDAHGAPLYFSV